MGYWKSGETILVTREFDGANNKWRRERYKVVDGVLLKDTPRSSVRSNFYDYKDRIVEWFSGFGYVNKAFDEKFAKRMLNPFVNQPIEVAEENIKNYAEKLKRRREEAKRDVERNRRLDELFRGYVVGLAKEIDVYRSGFSVRVLLSTKNSYQERRKFVSEDKRKIVAWTMKELMGRKKFREEVGDISFYKPVEIIPLRICEAEIKFEVKDDRPFTEPDYQKE